MIETAIVILVVLCVAFGGNKLAMYHLNDAVLNYQRYTLALELAKEELKNGEINHSEYLVRIQKAKERYGIR